MQLLTSGARRLRLSAGLTFAASVAVLALMPAASNAAFTLAPCHGSATAGRGATFPALLHNAGFWGHGFDSVQCASTAGAPTHPTYNSGTIDSQGAGSGASATGSGGGVGACGGGAGGWKAGHRDTTVRFCATDDPVTPTQLNNMNTGCDQYTSPVVCTPAVIHQLPWASGAVTIAVHMPEGCTLPAPGASQASSPVTGWSGDPSGDTAATNTTRPYISDLNLEKALAGDPTMQTWGQLVPAISGTATAAASGDAQDAGTSCASVPILRIVRSDNSGTTFNFKSFLGLVAGGIGGDPTNSGSWTGTTSNTGGSALGSTSTGANTAWPTGGSFGASFNAGATGHQTDANNVCEWNTATFASANSDVTTNHICGGHGTGASNVARGVLATSGSIGYVDIATARNTKLNGVTAPQQDLQDVQTSSGPRDYTFWLPVQNCPDQGSGCSQSYTEPTNDATNHQVSGSGMVGTQGANCSSLPNLRNVPDPASSPNGDATLGDWSHTVAVGGSGYPICVLTYGLIWDDNSKVYGNSAAEQAQARTVLDYVDFIASGFGQSFIGTDFSTMPANIQNIMRTGSPSGTGSGGIAAVDWNKSSCSGTSCGGTTTTTTTTTTSSVITTTATKPPPSNQFTISGIKARGRTVVVNLKLPGPGQLVVLATFKQGRKQVTFALLRSRVPGGTGQATLPPNAAARRALNRVKSLLVTVKVTFTPTGGKANSHSKSVKVKGKGKPAHKRKKKK